MRERFIRAVSKTVVAQVTVSSNLTLSAISNCQIKHSLTGKFIILCWAVFLVYWFVTALSFWIKARQEEKLMTKHFPEAYPKYRARVKALIPLVL